MPGVVPDAEDPTIKKTQPLSVCKHFFWLAGFSPDLPEQSPRVRMLQPFFTTDPLNARIHTGKEKRVVIDFHSIWKLTACDGAGQVLDWE